MWAVPESSEDEWNRAIDQCDYTVEAQIAAANCLCACSRMNEIYVGGDDSPLLVQILGASGDADELDVMATVLLPQEDVMSVFSVRGPRVKSLLASFWTHRPTAPVVVDRRGTYAPVLCGLRDQAWSMGHLCAAHIKKLRQREDTTEDLDIHVPAEPVDNKPHALLDLGGSMPTFSLADEERGRAATYRGSLVAEELCDKALANAGARVRVPALAA
jgi:hypothetical protein